ncbi:23S rRNA pseudouridine(2604) synthase RluF [Vibrio sp. SCSIO 43135]|uniref:23S rRNA pseudouridine(2604) synthase RluF n=1 Tax=Vibrio sp. SCSIO 43135 TaxID=2819096 RepID=UPI00207552DE|nr:23S rRNA pseudouridine(2604) synthase RluF [Vibrio sp. SCSIO 43135]USD40477.1 23S rRNA pseudouridine(2604) synthase RluF [Vibrio sp. SCSIO 43135]
MTTDNAKRLNKFISETGFCSRREADRLIEQGRVTINGKIPEMGTKVVSGDDVRVDDKPLKSKERPIYIALNKPTGITCTTERDVPGNIVDFIGHHKRIFPIGRLDKPSDGLIFLTNDGDIVNKILRAGNNHEKEYVVRVDKPITQEFLTHMASGVDILDTTTLPCKVTKETKFSFRIVLTQGLNRQIRRMCEALGYEVFKLRRVRIMNISLDGIPNGKWRYLSDDEVSEILSMCEDSSGTEDASKIDGKGKKIRKATDAKLFDSREENQPSKARRNQKQKTFHGRNADEFRHAPNSKKGRGKPDNSRTNNSKGNGGKGKTYYKPDNNESSTRQSNKPRKSGTLSLKK